MFLDIGFGILIALGAIELGGITPSLWLFVFSITVCLLPDFDVFLHMRKGRDMGGEAYSHRSHFHYPLVYIPLGTILISVISLPYGLIFFFGSLLHFVHDSIGIGWGVQWLAPFNKDHFAFFYHYDIYRHDLPKKWIYRWSPEEVPVVADQYGDKDWIRNIYFKWHPYAIVEFLVFVLATSLTFWLGLW